MREILFRAKRLDNGEWVEGNLIFSYDADKGWEAIIIPTNNSNMLFNSDTKVLGFENWHRVIQETICQYTEQTDKNGTKIFEGNVVKVKGKPYEVKYMLGQFFVGINMPISYKRFDCEVIGNIFDNPELLKEGAE